MPVHGFYEEKRRKIIIFVKMEEKKITIIDVANKAGVSKGTVDRVLHNRGEVSKKSAEKVRKAIEELSYEPNLYASLLATTKSVRTIACILPESVSGEYWSRIHKGIADGGDDVASFNVSTECFYYNQYEQSSFVEACHRLVESKPDAVVIPPLFKNATMELANDLTERGIPYVYVDTKLEDSNYFSYFGMPMYKSGCLCAHLLTENCSPEDVTDIAVIRIKRDKARQSDPTLTRRSGFNDFIEANFPECNLHSVFIDPSDPDGNAAVLDEFFTKEGPFKFVVMFNSRIHLVSDYLLSHPLPGRRVIGFDDLDGNMEALKHGAVTLLIAQHSDQQSRKAVNVLSDYILMHKQPSAKDNYMHMDILTKYNMEDY